MSNEALFLIAAVADILFIVWAYTRGRHWLMATIPINLILITIFGSKIISLFGFVTNAGNSFYACVFFATHILVERYGKEAGYKTIWFGAIVMLFFVAMAQLAYMYTGFGSSIVVNRASDMLFQFVPRIALASLTGYVVAQYFNVSVYAWLKRVTHGRKLWLRKNATNVVTQFIDSFLFFTIAFFGVLTPGLLLESMLVGWIVKVAVGFMATPALYLVANIEGRD
jgi:queuosine precursor transporter